jgi:hypothetical protein
MAKHHGFSIPDVENMIPFERDIYVMMIKEWVKETEKQAEKANRA